VLAVGSVAGLTGIPIAGSLQVPGTWANGFGPMILFSGVPLAISTTMFGLGRILMVGWKLNVKA
jgi:hypothetical protein